MVAYEQQAELLCSWRTEVAKQTQSQVAKTLFTTKSVISMWESAERGLTFQHLYALDRCYGAGGALAGIALAMGTPSGLAARTSWVHNPQGDAGTVWAWCRPGDGHRHMSVRVRWGAFAFECSSDCGDQGIFLTSPVSMPNPPAWVDLEEPGWVDFGRGEIPEQLGIPTFDALSGMRVATGGHSPAGLVAPHIVDCFITSPAFAQAVVNFFAGPAEVIRQVFSTTDGRKAVLDLTNGRPPAKAHQPFSGEQWCRLRQARCLSRRDTAEQVTALMPGQPVTDDQIELLEKGGNPQRRFLRSRLDRVYRADGHTSVEEVKASRTKPFTFTFPGYWIGPVWFTFSSQHTASTRAELRWGESYKQMQVEPGTTVTCRKPTEEPVPFVVVCPNGWGVTGGMGQRPDAWDVNWGWSNVNDASTRGDAPVHELLLHLFGRTEEEFQRFLDDYDRRGD
jgi:hypothetical protein